MGACGSTPARWWTMIRPTIRAALSARVSAGASCCGIIVASAASSTARPAARPGGTDCRRRARSALQELDQRALCGAHLFARRDERPAQRLAAGPRLVLLVLGHRRGEQLLHALEIGVEQLQYPLRGRMLCRILEPGVVIGRYRDGAVAQLRLQGEECLRHVGHADDIRTRGAQEQALRAGAEARTLDAGVGLVLVQRHAARVPRVKSRYCDGSASSPGWISARRLPTADTPITVRTPRLFSAQMLARKLISPGSSWCSRPWRARNTTSRPRSIPVMRGADGAPNGVDTVCARGVCNSCMAYKPVPPMMPIMARCAPLRRSFARMARDTARCLKAPRNNNSNGHPHEHTVSIARTAGQPRHRSRRFGRRSWRLRRCGATLML